MQQAECDIAVIGAGAAGLFAATFAARTLRELAPSRPPRVVALDGARKLGAKILVAGGGRCNVTHHAVDERQYAGSTAPAIRNVLRSFDVDRTVAFFAQQGVTLKREETGKLFPTTDDAHTVLDALLAALRESGASILHPWRVGSVSRRADGSGFLVSQDAAWPHRLPDAPDAFFAQRVILATGGLALPRTGSDGAGYAFARALGHSVTPLVCPALVPLLLPAGHPLTTLSGLAFPASITLSTSTGKVLKSFTNSTLCAHFGLSGPGPLDMSRHWTHAHAADPSVQLTLSVLPDTTPEQLDALLATAARDAQRNKLSVRRFLSEHLPTPQPLPERLAEVLLRLAGLPSEPAPLLKDLTRDQRIALARACTRLPLPVTGDRGYTYAEVTAGGVPLGEVHLATMASKPCAGLHLCGEVCDVDGRIGGFNFQWAWASGYLAGVGAARALEMDERA